MMQKNISSLKMDKYLLKKSNKMLKNTLIIICLFLLLSCKKERVISFSVDTTNSSGNMAWIFFPDKYGSLRDDIFSIPWANSLIPEAFPFTVLLVVYCYADPTEVITVTIYDNGRIIARKQFKGDSTGYIRADIQKIIE